MADPVLEVSKTKGITIVAVADVVLVIAPTIIARSITTIHEIDDDVHLHPIVSVAVVVKIDAIVQVLN